jgi:hypothetical protein
MTLSNMLTIMLANMIWNVFCIMFYITFVRKRISQEQFSDMVVSPVDVISLDGCGAHSIKQVRLTSLILARV